MIQFIDSGDPASNSRNEDIGEYILIELAELD